MSEASSQPEPQVGGLGYTSRTDVAGNVGTEAASNPSDHATLPPQPVEADAAQSGASGSTDAEAEGTKPGETLGKDAPKLSDLQGQMCPNCRVGVLQVTRYDPDALHEREQGASLLKGHESGGAYEVVCPACSYSDSRALNPGKFWGR